MSVAADVSVSMATATAVYIYISLNLDLSLVWPFLGLSEWAAEGVYLCVHVERFIFQPLRFLFTIFFSPSILNE